MKLQNKKGPYVGITGGFRQCTTTRGDPDIGKYKRGRAPCPSSLNSSLFEGWGKFLDRLKASRLTGIINPEWESYIQLSMTNCQLSMDND